MATPSAASALLATTTAPVSRAASRSGVEREVDERGQRSGEDVEVVAGEVRLGQHHDPGTPVGRLADQPGRRTDVGGEVAGHGLGLGGGDREDHWTSLTTTSMRWNSLSSV